MRFAFIYPDDFSIVRFRSKLASTLIAHGHEVYAICQDTGYVSELRKLGIHWREALIERNISPIKDFKLIFKLAHLFRSEKIDIVHNFTIKPNIFGSLGARLAGVHCIYNSVTGLGIIGEGEASCFSVRKFLATSLYRMINPLVLRTWFQNQDDLDFFVANRLVTREKAVLVRGSGVDTNFWSPASVPSENQNALRRELRIELSQNIVVMVSRVIRSKGVMEFFEAARRLHSSDQSLQFILIGPYEKRGGDSVDINMLKSESGKGGFCWLGPRTDIREILSLATVVVLPSYYAEGLPRSLLEAMAMEKPIITTDMPGCREVIIENRNGLLIPPRSTDDLVIALKRLFENKEELLEMGKVSRAIVKEHFEEQSVANALVEALYKLGSCN